MCFKHKESGFFFFLACFNEKKFLCSTDCYKVCYHSNKRKVTTELASSCIRSSALLLTAMKNNLNSVLLINRGNNRVSLAVFLIFPIKTVNGFGRTVYLPFEKFF